MHDKFFKIICGKKYTIILPNINSYKNRKNKNIKQNYWFSIFLTLSLLDITFLS